MPGWLSDLVSDEDGDSSAGFVIAMGLCAVAGALWLVQVGGVEGVADGLVTISRFLRHLAGLMPWN